MSVYQRCKDFCWGQAGWLVALWLMTVIAAPAQVAYPLSSAALQNNQVIELDKLPWKYVPGDEARFADPQFDDSAWETVQGTSFTPQRMPQSGWQGIGWFRLRLNVDAALLNQALALLMAHHGAAEVYLDGKLLQRYGTVGATPATEVEANPVGVPLEFSFGKAGEHLLAVRRSQARWQEGFNWRGYTMRTWLGTEIGAVGVTETGFRIQLDRLSTAQARRYEYLRNEGAGGLFIGGIFAALGFLHLMFFFFYRPQRANLWFGLYCLLVFFLMIFIRMTRFSLEEIAPGLSGMMNLFTFGYFLTRSNAVMLLAFLYTSFEGKLPRLFYLYTVNANQG